MEADEMGEMSGKQRMLAALTLKQPDRVPVSLHDIVEYYRKTYLNGISRMDAYRKFGLDAMEYFDPEWLWSHGFGLPTIEKNTDEWSVTRTQIGKRRGWVLGLDWMEYEEVIHTPKGQLIQKTLEQTNVGGFDSWVTERLIKEKNNIDLLQHWSLPEIDYGKVDEAYERLGDSGILRGQVWGVWSEASLFTGVERLILETFDDPGWVKDFVYLLARRTVEIVKMLADTKIELLEISETDTSISLISPLIFEEFVLPFDRLIIDAAHDAGMLTTFHNCGKCMDILELIKDTGTNAIETMAPPGIGGDVDIGEAKRRVGDKVCLIGGIDQSNVLERGSSETIHNEVKKYIEDAAEGGGYIMTNADHFFSVPAANIFTYMEAARMYGVY
jgi:uroporphyrinogen-III decarboxylase